MYTEIPFFYAVCSNKDQKQWKLSSFHFSYSKSQNFKWSLFSNFRKEVLEHFSDTQASSGGTSNRQQVEDAPPSYDDYLKSLESGVCWVIATDVLGDCIRCLRSMMDECHRCVLYIATSGVWRMNALIVCWVTTPGVWWMNASGVWWMNASGVWWVNTSGVCDGWKPQVCDGWLPQIYDGWMPQVWVG